MLGNYLFLQPKIDELKRSIQGLQDEMNEVRKDLKGISERLEVIEKLAFQWIDVGEDIAKEMDTKRYPFPVECRPNGCVVAESALTFCGILICGMTSV